MEYLYETIEHKSRLPINIFTHTISNFPYHWHEDTEILFVLSGSVELTIDNQKTNYNEGNIFVINSNDLHSLISTSENNLTTLLALQFNLNHFSEYNISSETRFRIDYEKKGSEKRDVYNKLRLILAMMMRAVINKEEPQQLIIERHLIDILIVLMNNFSALQDDDKEQKSEQKRIVQLIKHINANCKDRDISLESVAEHFHLNSQYLSRYFKNKVGISFKKFLDNMRLNKSLEKLKYSNDRIIDIALAYGFADSKAYYRVFKDILNTTPAEYRELHKVDTQGSKPKDYFSINKKETLSKLFEYLKYDIKNDSEVKQINEIIKVDLKQKGRKYSNSAQKLTTFGYAPHGLRSDFDKQLKMLQKDIGFEYIRFHGIFADQLLVYNKKPDGEVYFNFNHVDELLDRLLENNIKPFLELGFMPKDLASTDSKIFWWDACVSPPNDMNKWLNLLETFFKHLLNRYGTDEVLSWYFEFWNEPELVDSFFDNDVNVFYDFFKNSYLRIKKVNKDIRVGGFGTTYIYLGEEWIKSFVLLAKKDNIKLDFSSFHIYQVIIQDDEKSMELIEEARSKKHDTLYNENVDFTTIGAYLGDSEHINKSIDNCLDYLKESDITDGEYFITEFNSNTDSRDLVHDTCYSAAYIVKSIIENMEKVDGIGYWTFTDIFEEFRLPQPIFHGGFGLITYNGIKKPAYNAYVFLSKLGDVIVHKSDGYIVTRCGEDYQILLYNYCHYNELYSAFDYSQINQTQRYDVFKNQKKKSLSLKLNGIRGKYKIETHRVNRDQGSSFDAWVAMGAPHTLSDEAYNYLVSAACPGYEVKVKEIKHNTKLYTVLDPHEIQLITLKKQY